MPVALSVETTIEAVLGAPVTYDDTGFAALSYTAIGEVESMGQLGGSAQVTNFTPLATGIVAKLPGSIDYGQASLSIGRLAGDAGQDLLKAGFDGANARAQHSFKVTLPDATVYYFTGYIVSFETVINDANAVTMINCNIELDNAVVIV